MSKILIVEDEASMLSGLKDNLEFEDYEVDTASDGMSGYKKIITNSYNLVLLDVMLPGMSGFDICKEVRKQGIKTPIILLTAKGEEIDKVIGLELGADDYITKPFSLRELLARIKAVLRRYDSDQTSESSENVTIGNLEVNFDKYTASHLGQEIHFTHKEFEVLKFLHEHKNSVIGRDRLVDAVWGMDYTPTLRTVDNFIMKLRQRIEDTPASPRILITVHGVGYKLVL
jgi:DNA-binding response OmpR family regulator